jgi:hypothetical protein
MKLFTIGDSISQGFMSGAAARTNLAYSTLIAGCMGLEDGYEYPRWAAGGLPINLEIILRRLEKQYGDNVNPLEWALALGAWTGQTSSTATHSTQIPSP